MSGIRIHAAAEYLGVSPNTLRSWERRFGHPGPRRSQGGHRLYELNELEALRRALAETSNISSAIELARRRGEGPPSGLRLIEALDRFDDGAADRVLEESLAVRPVERTLDELLLPAIEATAERPGREAEHEFGCRWATGWLHAARRVAPAATRGEGLLVFDASLRLGLEALHAQALELALRRAGFRVLLLSIGLEHGRIARAIRALEPAVIVLAGSDATLDVLGRLIYAAGREAGEAPVVEYRDATPVAGAHRVPSLGTTVSEAVATVRAMLERESAGWRRQQSAKRRQGLTAVNGGGAAGLSRAPQRPVAAPRQATDDIADSARSQN